MSGDLPAAVKTPQPVVIMNSVLAAVGFVMSGGALAGYLDAKLLGLLLLAYGAVQIGWGVYTKSVVTPNVKVASVVGQSVDTGKPELQAGLAAPGVLKPGDPVTVAPAADTDWFGDPKP